MSRAPGRADPPHDVSFAEEDGGAPTGQREEFLGRDAPARAGKLPRLLGGTPEGDKVRDVSPHRLADGRGEGSDRLGR